MSVARRLLQEPEPGIFLGRPGPVRVFGSIAHFTKAIADCRAGQPPSGRCRPDCVRERPFAIGRLGAKVAPLGGLPFEAKDATDGAKRAAHRRSNRR